jgi:hypothetical protein
MVALPEVNAPLPLPILALKANVRERVKIEP